MVSVALGFADLKCAKFKSVYSLFDAGSPRCFVRRSMVSTFKEKPLCKTGHNLGNIELLSYGNVITYVKLKNKMVRHEFIVVPDDLLFTPMIIGRDFFRKANIKLISFKQHYSKKTLMNLNNNNNLNNKLLNKLNSLGILRSSVSFECRFDTLTTNFLDKFDNDLVSLDIADNTNIYFEQICAIDCASDTDEKFDINLSLPVDQLQSLRSAIHDAYYNTEVDPLCYDKHCMKIEITSQVPIYRRPRRLSHQQRNEVREIVSDLLKRNIICPSNAPYAPLLCQFQRNLVKLDFVLTIGH